MCWCAGVTGRISAHKGTDHSTPNCASGNVDPLPFPSRGRGWQFSMADGDVPDRFVPAIRWVISGIVLFVFFLVAVEKANEGHYWHASINGTLFVVALLIAVKWQRLVDALPPRRRQVALTLIALGAALLALGIALLAYQTETVASLPATPRNSTQSSTKAPELEGMQRALDSKAQELDVAKRELEDSEKRRASKDALLRRRARRHDSFAARMATNRRGRISGCARNGGDRCSVRHTSHSDDVLARGWRHSRVAT